MQNKKKYKNKEGVGLMDMNLLYKVSHPTSRTLNLQRYEMYLKNEVKQKDESSSSIVVIRNPN